MGTPTIVRGSEHFFNVTYEGNGGGQRVGKFIPFTDNGTIAKSCLFNDNDSAYLNRTSGTATSTRIFTVSVWAKRANIGTQTILNLAPLSGSTAAPTINWGASATIQLATSGGSTMNKITTRTFEDTSKWYHIVARFDTTQSTAADRVRLYVDGDQITDFGTNTIPSQNTDFVLNSQVMQIGRATSGGSPTQYLDGYLAELHYADGQSYGPDTFGITDTSTGRWIPKSLGSITYGNNGFRMEFANSAGQTIGDDTSGNTNDFTVNNLAASDITTDSPTQNHNTVEPHVNPGSDTLSEGNLKTVGGSSTYSYTVGTMKLKRGKYYAEFKVTAGGGNATQIGIAGRHSTGSTNHLGYNPTTYSYYFGGQVYLGLSTNSPTSWGSSYTDNDYVGVALDLDNNKLYFAKNNTWQNSSNPVTGANAIGIIPPEDTQFGGYAFAVGNFEGAGGPTVEHNYGQKSFQYTPPDGYVAVQQDNLPTTEKGISGLTWIKNRDAADSHQLYDSSRGPLIKLSSDIADAQLTINDGLQKFLKGGFQLEDNNAVNTSNESYVAWNWVANGGTTSANADGSGASLASTIQANQTAGFSIVTYTGSASGSKTVAHGLSEAPQWIAIKNRTDSSRSWFIYVPVTKYDSTPQNRYFRFDSDDSHASGNVFDNTAPTNKVFSIQDAGSLNTNGSGKNYIAYCWHSVEGYSKVGGWYEGNGSTNGPFVYTGFKPAWLLIKGINIGNSWQILDNLRDPINPVNKVLEPDSTATDATGHNIDFLANGFKIRTSDADINGSYAYWYAAFAEHPFVGDGTNPCTAR